MLIKDAQKTGFDDVTDAPLNAFATDPISGDCIVVFMHTLYATNSPTHLAPTDTASNTYTQIGSTLTQENPPGSYHKLSMWYSQNITGGASFVVTGHASAGGLGNGVILMAWALTGVSPTAYNGDVGTTVTINGTTDDLTVLTVGTPAAESLFIGGCGMDGPISPGAGLNTIDVYGFTTAMKTRVEASPTRSISGYMAASVATTLHFTDGGAAMTPYIAIAASFSGVSVPSSEYPDFDEADPAVLRHYNGRNDRRLSKLIA